MEQILYNALPHLNQDRIVKPRNITDIFAEGYMVYILFHNLIPIVLGHGRRNRAKVIFDDETRITRNHIKAIFVRLYHLYGNGSFNRFIIPCQSKEEAKEIERMLHQEIVGNYRYLPDEITYQLFQGIDESSVEFILMQIMLNSSFDGLSDFRKWKSKGILTEKVSNVIEERFSLKI